MALSCQWFLQFWRAPFGKSRLLLWLIVFLFIFNLNCHNSQLIASLYFVHTCSPVWKCKTPYLYLCFSVHSMSLIFGLEFVDLDLVTFAFVNLFSWDDSIRKWDYVPPTIFKHALEVVLYIIACFWYMIFVHIHCSIRVSYFSPLQSIVPWVIVLFGE